MERIASFSIDHTRLLPGMYLSRTDGEVITWDIRMRRPNMGDYLSTGTCHALEHLFATYLRNGSYKEHVVYVGPMGCRTGCYVLTQGLTHAEALDMIREGFEATAAHEGPVPGASPEECGNYRDMDPEGARAEARHMLEVLKDWTPEQMKYKYYLD